MVSLDDVRTSNAALVQSQQPVVAVFFGGTSGIGHYTLRALATAAANAGGKEFRAYIVGRKEQAAEQVIAECRGICPAAQITFVKADDLSLIGDVDRVCADIIQLEERAGGDNPRIDYLMLSHAGAIFLPRKDTKEGIDVTMSLMYYSRMRAIMQLLPLLLKSRLPTKAKVVSVFAAGMEDKLYPDDLSLREPSLYNYSQARSHMVYMHTLFMESLAEQHSGQLSLIHIFPGLVLGPGFSNPDLPAWFRLMWHWIFVPLFGRLVSVPAIESGDRMVSLASSRYPPRPNNGSQNAEGMPVATGTDGKPGSGAYSLGWKGDDNIKAAAYEKFNKAEMRKHVWDHTLNAFAVIEEGSVFTE